MSTHPFEELADAAAAGLADDREVYLDVRQELRAHLQDKRDYLQRQGHDAGESTALAMKAFGSPLEVADELLQANKARLSLRALARLGIRALLIPATVLLALWIAWDLGQTIKLARLFTLQVSGKTPVAPVRIAESGRRAEDVQLLLYGDRRRKRKAGQLHAIWERHQDNKAYFANYALALYPTGAVPTARELALLEREYRRGERFDPENALYNYLLADAFYAAGGKLEAVKSKKRHSRGQPEKPVFTLTVMNRALLDRAMDEMVKGAAKPHCTTYTQELYRERLACVRTPTRFADAIVQQGVLGDFPFMSALSFISKPGRALPLYVRLLEQEGKTERAHRVLTAWLPFLAHWNDASVLMLQPIIVRQLLKDYGPVVAAQYERFGDPKTAAKVHKLSVQAAAILQDAQDPYRFVDKQRGFLAGIYFPLISGVRFTSEELAPSRLLEYTVVEEAAIALIVLLLLYAMLHNYLLSVRWYHGLKAARSAPLLLLPPFPVLLRIVLLGVILPLGFYVLYLHVPALSGRVHGLSTVEQLARLLVELICVIIVLLVLPGRMAQQYLRRRCDDLGISVPQACKPSRLRMVLLVIGGLLALWLLPKMLPFAIYLYGTKMLPYLDPLAFVLLGVGVLALLLPLKMQDRGLGLFHGSVARSLVPVYALVVILIGGLAYPYLVRQETRLVRQETLFLPSREPHWPGLAEYRFVQDAREKLQAAFRECGFR